MSDCSCSNCSCTSELTPTPLQPTHQAGPLRILFKTQRKELIRATIAILLLITITLLKKYFGTFLPYAYGITLLVTGGPIFISAAKSLSKGHGMDETFLMSVAAIGAFAIGQYPEGIAVMLFYQIGELFQAQAIQSSRNAISTLVDLRPKMVHLIASPANAGSYQPETNARTRDKHAAAAQVGSIVLVKAGEQIPLDGTILKGKTTMNTALLTGESLPRPAEEGDEVKAGYINGSHPIHIQTTSTYENSAIARILSLLEDSHEKKATQDVLIKRFAKIYTPIVVAAACIVGLFVPTLLSITLAGNGAFSLSLYSPWIYKALVFLVVSCPCALVISVPLTYFASIGAFAKQGILVKGETYIEQLADVSVCIFDKTGTLTLGQFSVLSDEVLTDAFSRHELLTYLKETEDHSNHPLAQSISQFAREELNNEPSKTFPAHNLTEVPGRGISGDIDGRHIQAGNLTYLDQLATVDKERAQRLLNRKAGQIIFMSIDDKLVYAIELADTIKTNAKRSVSTLKKYGITTILLTGDEAKAAHYVGDELEIDIVHAQLLPKDKVALVEKYTKDNTRGKTVFCGDGINDAPSLARSDIGIAMGGLGSDAAIEASDAVFTHDDIGALPSLIKSAKRTVRIVKQNIAFALIIKLGILLLALFGIASMWSAVFADVGVTILLIFNALRAMR